MKIILSGPKCSGKSAIASILSDRIGLSVCETDSMIEGLFREKNGKDYTCRMICSEYGEDIFREYEAEAVRTAAGKDYVIISAGGSTLLNRSSRQLLRHDSVLVLLYASPEVLIGRFRNKNTPAYLQDKTTIDLFSARCSLVIDVLKPYADIAVDTSSLTIEEVAGRIIGELETELEVRSQRPNTFGDIVRLSTFGESHGPAIGAVLDGIKPGIPLSESDIQKELDRRKPGQSPVTTSRREDDKVRILSGVFNGLTTGTPIAMVADNADHDSSRYEKIKDYFRPGTADFTFWKKYGIRDYRGGGRASGRETASRVMGGAAAIKILRGKGVGIIAHAVEIAGIRAVEFDKDVIEKNAVRCADATQAVKMEEAILSAKKEGDSVGGIAQIEITGVPAGLGDPVFCKLSSRLAAAFMSVGAVKGVEFGDGFALAGMKGSEANDSMSGGRLCSNHSGGMSGGISNGEKIVARVAVRATPSISKSQKTCDTSGRNVDIEIEGRHDPCIVPRIIPVLESMAALVLLDAWSIQEKIRQGDAR